MVPRRALALFIVVAISCSAPAAATPTPPVGATASEPASPAAPSVAPAVPSAKFGILSLTRDGFAVRPETDPKPIRTVAQIEHRLPGGIAVSNDGRYVAYWRPIDPGGDDLMLYDAAANADPINVARLSDATGGAIAWADDDSGLAFVSRPFARGAPMTLSTMATTDRIIRPVATGVDDIELITPLTWIRETKSVSAIAHSPEGVVRTYVLAKESGETSRFAVGDRDQVVRVEGIAVDPQSRILTYLVKFTCQDGKPGCTLIRFWALEDPQQADWKSQTLPESPYERAWWRPFTRSAIASVRGAEPMLRTFCITKSCGRSSINTSPERVLIRPDGSALLGASFSSGWPGTMYSLSAADDKNVDLTTAGGGAPTFSVVLDSATASRIDSAQHVTPLLTQDEAIAMTLAKGGPSVNKTMAVLDRGTYPLAGRIATWRVIASGRFELNTRGGPIVVPCMIWELNARLGTLIEQRWITDVGACPV